MNKSFGYYCLRFVGFAVVIIVLMAVLVNAFYAFAPDLAENILGGGGGTGANMVGIILPPLLTAQVFYKHEQRLMTPREGWSMAVVFTLLAIAISAALIWIYFLFVPLTAAEMGELASLWQSELTFILVFGGGFAVFILLMTKLMLWSGARGAMKNAEKLAIKAARNG